MSSAVAYTNGLKEEPGLTLGLQGPVELALREGKPADDGMHAARMRIHGDEAAADLGDLHERPDTRWLGSVLGRDPDDVAYAEDVGPALGRRGWRAHFTSSKGSRRLALGGEVPSAWRAGRRPTTALVAGLAEPRRDATAARSPESRCRQRHAPVAGDVDLLHRTAPALLPVESDKAVDQSLARHLLHIGIERGPDREAAVHAIADAGAFGAAVEAVLAVDVDQRRRTSSAK